MVIQIPLLISIILNNLLTSNTVFTIYMATVRQRKPLSSSRSNKAVVTVDPVCHPFHLIPTLGCTNNFFFRFKQRFPFFSPHNDQHVKCRKETRDISLLCSLVSHNIQQKKRSEFKHTNFWILWKLNIKLIFVCPNKMTARWLLTALTKSFKKLAGKVAHPRFLQFLSRLGTYGSNIRSMFAIEYFVIWN